jgi:hypothetical protein
MMNAKCKSSGERQATFIFSIHHFTFIIPYFYSLINSM